MVIRGNPTIVHDYVRGSAMVMHGLCLGMPWTTMILRGHAMAMPWSFMVIHYY